MSLSRFSASRTIVFSVAFLSLSAVILSVWQAWTYYTSRAQRQSLIEASAVEFTDTLRESTNHYFSGIFSSFYIVSQSSELLTPASPLSLPGAGLENLFRAFLNGNTNASIIRYIDQSGRELLRLDKYAGLPQRAPIDALQYKGDRDYFKQGMNANIGEFYISELDLNVENGKVELPWRPTIRAATPIDSNADSIKDGLLVINIDTEALFAFYASQESRINDLDTTNKLMVLNEDGYWLYGVERENLWGFMYDATQKVSVQYPQVWQYMSVADQEALVRDDQSAWVYSKNRVNTFFPSELQYQAPYKPAWHFLVHGTDDRQGSQLVSIGLPILILFALILLSLGWSKAVHERRKMEGNLVRTEKLKSLGSLVAGISHELNTPIGNAVTVTSALVDISHDIRNEIATGSVNKSSIVNFIDDVEEASLLALRSLERAAELIADFKEISVDQMSISRREFELDNYVRHITSTIAHLFKGSNKTLKLELDAPIKMRSFPGPLSQVIINIIQNSLLHGFEKAESGQIVVSTSTEGDDKVRISISDNGKGIPSEIIDRIFEPFFTTRLGDGGTGLGLHLVHNIATNVLGGEITLTSSASDHETIFDIVIPISAPELPREQNNYYRT